MTTDDAVPLEIDAPAPCDRIERSQRSEGHPAPRVLVTFGSVRDVARTTR